MFKKGNYTLFFAACAVIFFALLIGVVIAPGVVFAQTAAGGSTTSTAAVNASTSALQAQIDANNQQMAALNQQIATYQVELQQVGANKKTLQAAINALNLQKNKVQAQVTLTQKQINTTQLQIEQLGTQITSAQQTVATDQVSLADNIRMLQKADSQSPLIQMLSSGDITDVWDNANTILQLQSGIQQQIQTLNTQTTALANTQAASKQKQATLTSQQQLLASQQTSLVATEQSKTQLLAETNAQESTYEKLLAAAEAELSSFSAFAQNAGGSKLLGNQTVCDAWGCYYNQRDTAWGNDPLDGTKYNLASDGCLVTAMAMVMTHYGYKDVTPVTINSNPNNFAPYYPAYMLATINVDGASVTRVTSAINAILASGNPAIIGLHAYGGTHYVVFTSKSGGDYIMRDPYIMNGNDISFSAHYSLRDIFSAAKVQIES